MPSFTTRRKSELEKFWDRMTEEEKKNWPKELEKILAEDR